MLRERRHRHQVFRRADPPKRRQAKSDWGMKVSDLNEEIRRELANLQGQLGSMIQSIDDNLPPAFVPLFLKRLDLLIAQARLALSFLDKEDGDFIESFWGYA